MGSFTSADVSAVTANVDAVGAELVRLSHEISADPELSYEEHRAAARCADLLEKHGFAVERGSYGQPTSFEARLGSGDTHVMICAEYDALPGVGHACGHNIIAASALGAGIALAPLVDGANLRLTVLGTHAEEVGGGKVELIDGGALDGVDAALMMHPTPYDDYGPKSLAIEEWRVVYRGHASHASAAPELGRNALDGVVAGYNNISMLRQSFRKWQQVHGVIVDGGEAANVIPERAEASYYLRAVDLDDLEDLRTRVRACLEGAATATGTTVEITVNGYVYESLKPHTELVSIFTEACTAIGREFYPDPKGDELGGSTDFGNISNRVPGLHADMAVYSYPAVNHQHEFAAACISPEGDKTMLEGAKALALTALAVAADPSRLAS
ncbi:MAG TPA: M20 family metallopeptidase [Actinomycetes bacterium]|nr:M20 family metallopeptidase [Actinomycetes bacterium]